MWGFASNAIASIGLKSSKESSSRACSEFSDDDVCSNGSKDEGLECPICWESFNIVENVPYVLWCGHTLCQNCIFGLQPAVLKLPTSQFDIPLFVTCPWCHLLSPRLVYRGNLKFPRKNFFLLWMIESLNGDRYGVVRRNSSLDNQASNGDGYRVPFDRLLCDTRECCYLISLLTGDGCFCCPVFLGDVLCIPYVE